MTSVAYIVVNGEKVLGYRPDSNKIATPTTIPHKVVDQLASRYFGEGVLAGIGYPYLEGNQVTERLEEKVFRTRYYIVEMVEQLILEKKTLPNGGTFTSSTSVGTRRFEFGMEFVNDYRL